MMKKVKSNINSYEYILFDEVESFLMPGNLIGHQS